MLIIKICTLSYVYSIIHVTVFQKYHKILNCNKFLLQRQHWDLPVCDSDLKIPNISNRLLFFTIQVLYDLGSFPLNTWNHLNYSRSQIKGKLFLNKLCTSHSYKHSNASSFCHFPVHALILKYTLPDSSEKEIKCKITGEEFHFGLSLLSQNLLQFSQTTFQKRP